MFWRALIFSAFLASGALFTWVLSSHNNSNEALFSGGLIGAVAWFVFDGMRAAKALRCLRSDQACLNQVGRGVWGEVLERAGRLLRLKERARQEAENRLQDFLLALQASPNGVVLLDAHHGIEWCNQTAAAHFGLDLSRDLQQNIGNLVRDPGFAGYLEQRRFDHELAMPGRQTTATHPVRLSVQVHPYAGDRLLLLSRDVTALEQAETMRRDFVANVSHEIRTPLTVLAGFVETLQSLNLSASERASYLQLMAEQATRMQSLVSDLLTLSRLEGNPVPSLETWTATGALMRNLEQDARALSALLCPAAAPQQLNFDCTFEGELAGVPSELHSAMGNLVSNAVRYTPAAGQVDVALRRLADGQLQFAVHDTGPGIAAEHLPRLTERFYRVDRSRSRETGGTGLGLAIVKHVAQRHGAELSIESKPAHGSTFRLTFPAMRVRTAAERPAMALAVGTD